MQKWPLPDLPLPREGRVGVEGGTGEPETAGSAARGSGEGCRQLMLLLLLMWLLPPVLRLLLPLLRLLHIANGAAAQQQLTGEQQQLTQRRFRLLDGL